MLAFLPSIILFVLACVLKSEEAQAFVGVFAMIGFIIVIIAQIVSCYSQVQDIENIEKEKNNKVIYQSRADDLLGEFKTYLADMYPDIEKEIFKTMKPEKITAYMVKYPELKSSETICKLVNLINEIKGQVYGCDLRINQLKTDIRIRKRTSGMWLIGRLIPKE